MKKYIFVALVVFAGYAFAGSDEYHDCMGAGGYHEECKHHLD